MNKALFVLYVADQSRSRDFYAAVLGCNPTLDVPGMTEFPLPGGAALGLMPEQGIAQLLEGRLSAFEESRGCSKCELYLIVDDAAGTYERALAAGARELSPLAKRSWGQEVAYCSDSDGHVLAIAAS